MSFAFPSIHPTMLPPSIYTPQPEEDTETLHKEQTPSPQAVNEFSKANSDSNRYDVVSDLISDHLVTDYVVCTEENGSSNVSLPELLAPPACDEDTSDDCKTSDGPQKDKETAEVAFSSPSQTKMKASNKDTASLHPWAPTTPNTNIIIGLERKVTFYTESLGIKLSRHTDGFVRILSVSPYRPMSSDEKVRDGEIHEGDLIREVCNVDLRKPIDSAIWKLTVGLIKMAPRPLEFVVATEYEEVEDVSQAQLSLSDNGTTRLTSTKCEITGQTILPSTPDERRNLAPTRQVVFHEASLGVKLQHTSKGYVVVNSVSAVDSTKSPPSRTGELKPGDVVLEVGGVWDLYHPISINAWGILVKFIRECRRPMRMVVASEEYLTMMSPGSCSDESLESMESPGNKSMDIIQEVDEMSEGEESKANSTLATDEPTECSDVDDGT